MLGLFLYFSSLVNGQLTTLGHNIKTPHEVVFFFYGAPEPVSEAKIIDNCFCERCPTKQGVIGAVDLRRRQNDDYATRTFEPGIRYVLLIAFQGYAARGDFLPFVPGVYKLDFQGFDSRANCALSHSPGKLVHRKSFLHGSYFESLRRR